MASIFLDFDHTVNNNVDIADGERFSKPFPDAKTVITAMKADGHKITIYSCNRAAWIREWMDYWQIPYDSIWEGDKPLYDCLIDDRAVAFRGDWLDAYSAANEIIGSRNPMEGL